MMRVKSLDVLGQVWKVKYHNPLINPDDGQDVAGYTCFQNDLICISTKVPAHIDHTLIHEMIHATIQRSSIRQVPSWSIEIEEIVCNNIATVLLENFRIVALKK